MCYISSVQWKVAYYKNKGGKEPVAEFLDSLTDKERAKIFRMIDLLASRGVLLKKPYVDRLRGKIWELRISGENRITRLFYFLFSDRTFILLHAIVKKTQRTPKRAIDIAEERMNDFIRRI